MQLYHLKKVNAFETLNIKISIYDIVSILKTSNRIWCQITTMLFYLIPKKRVLLKLQVPNYSGAFLQDDRENSERGTITIDPGFNVIYVNISRHTK